VLTGPLPDEVGDLTLLQYLYLNDNLLSGRIPASVGNLAGLEDLQLFRNGFAGGLPAELGRLTRLYGLDASDNCLLREPIPREVALLTDLLYLSLGRNALSGPRRRRAPGAGRR
jgi:Leucine-rich repeat (LRR) protein